MKTERGFTLIELLIASMLSVMVLIFVGSFLINSLTTERTVRDATTASNAGQLVAQSVTKGVRNARAISPIASAGTDMISVRAVSSGSTATLYCQAWFYSNGEVRTTTSSSAIAVPNPDEFSTWTLLGEGISPDLTFPVFAVTDRSVDLRFEISTGEGQPVLISTTAVSRQPEPPTEEGPSC